MVMILTASLSNQLKKFKNLTSVSCLSLLSCCWMHCVSPYECGPCVMQERHGESAVACSYKGSPSTWDLVFGWLQYPTASWWSPNCSSRSLTVSLYVAPLGFLCRTSGAWSCRVVSLCMVPFIVLHSRIFSWLACDCDLHLFQASHNFGSHLILTRPYHDLHLS